MVYGHNQIVHSWLRSRTDSLLTLGGAWLAPLAQAYVFPQSYTFMSERAMQL